MSVDSDSTRKLDVLALGVVVLAAVIVHARNLYVDYPIVFQDEYLYKALSDRTLDQQVLLARGLVVPMPNQLYFALYGLGSAFRSNHYAFAQLLNVVFWALGLWALYRFAELTGLTRARALLFLAAAALLPFSSYTKYFMPDLMFFAMFCGSLYWLMLGVVRERDRSLAAAGLLMGLMYFVKPHALVLAGATSFFLLFHAKRLRRLGLFVGPFVAALAVGRLLSAPKGDAASDGMGGLGLYAYVLQKVASQAAQAKAATIAEVAEGHLLFSVCALSLALVMTVAIVVGPLRLRDRAALVAPELKALAQYVLILGVTLVGMSVVYTALSGEAGRIHSRYYFFLYPLGLLLLFHFDSIRLTAAGRAVGLFAAISGPLSMGVLGRSYSWVVSVALVPDCPEWGFVFSSTPIFYGALAGLGAAGAAAVLRPRWAPLLVGVIALTSVLSVIRVTELQRTVYLTRFVTGREAIATEELIGKERMSGAVLVGENRDAVTKFLFHLTSTPYLLELAPGSSLESIASKFPEATHIIALSETYLVPPELSCTGGPQPPRICAISR